MCHAEAEGGAVLRCGFVGEVRRSGGDGVGKGKMVRGRRGGGGLGFDRGRCGGEEGLWVCDAKVVSVRIKGHLGVRERSRGG